MNNKKPVHFDYKAAIACADVGVDKIRINPGNIGDDDRVKAVVDACQQKNTKQLVSDRMCIMYFINM